MAPFHNFDMLSIEALAHFNKKSLLGFRTLLVKTVQIIRCQGFQKLGDNAQSGKQVNMRNPMQVFFLSIAFQKR